MNVKHALSPHKKSKANVFVKRIINELENSFAKEDIDSCMESILRNAKAEVGAASTYT
jgi:hypothetical protein